MAQQGFGGFKNNESRLFYKHYAQAFERGTLDKEVVNADFGFKTSYGYSFWRMLKEGSIGIKTDHLLIGQAKHGLNLLYVMGISDNAMASVKGDEPPAGYAFEPSVHYGEGEQPLTLRVDVGRTIDGLLTKHKVPRTAYASRLQMSPRNLQKIISGEVSPYFSTVAQIAEDLGESLDVFRATPLPKGHLLALVKEKELRIEAQEKLIKQLSKAAK